MFVACGKPPCGALADVCGSCNAVAATACRATVAANVDAACQLAMDSKVYVAGSPSCGAVAPQATTGPTGVSARVTVDDDKSASGCSYPQVQTLSEPCCESHGVDACGAGLFCAAFDDRTIGTCYALRTRADLAECSEDEQCQSGQCHPKKKQCLSQQYGVCEVAVGCAENAFGSTTTCKVGEGGVNRCST